ncbi:MAG: hypothetical protein WAN48_10695 [Actinomycetes bacterium]
MGVTRHVRAARWAGAVLVGLAPLPMLSLAASAEETTFTAAAATSPGGNKGTIKVHEEGTPSGTVNNDPKVCVFNIEGFFFQTGQTGYVIIEPQGGNGGPSTVGPVAWGPADGSGFAATEYFNGPTGIIVENGHYKATLYGKMLPTGQLEDVKAKSKVFKVVCETSTTTPPNETTTPPTTTTSGSSSGPVTTPATTKPPKPTKTTKTPSVLPTESTKGAPATTSSKAPTVLPTRSSQPAVLPQTGSSFPTGGALAASLLLVALGALLLLGPGRAIPFKQDRRH